MKPRNFPPSMLKTTFRVHSEDKSLESEEEIQPCEGDLLMVRRLLKKST